MATKAGRTWARMGCVILPWAGPPVRWVFGLRPGEARPLLGRAGMALRARAPAETHASAVVCLLRAPIPPQSSHTQSTARRSQLLIAQWTRANGVQVELETEAKVMRRTVFENRWTPATTRAIASRPPRGRFGRARGRRRPEATAEDAGRDAT